MRVLNQARAGQSAGACLFLEIAFVREVGMLVCVCPRPEAINNESRYVQTATFKKSRAIIKRHCLTRNNALGCAIRKT